MLACNLSRSSSATGGAAQALYELPSFRSISGSFAKFDAIRRERWRQSGATQQHVRNRGISGSERLSLETTLMTLSDTACL